MSFWLAFLRFFAYFNLFPDSWIPLVEILRYKYRQIIVPLLQHYPHVLLKATLLVAPTRSFKWGLLPQPKRPYLNEFHWGYFPENKRKIPGPLLIYNWLLKKKHQNQGIGIIPKKVAGCGKHLAFSGFLDSPSNLGDVCVFWCKSTCEASWAMKKNLVG